MNKLKKILNTEESKKYPPKEELWNKIISLISEDDNEKLSIIKNKMERELSRYKPQLPEPELVRFFYKGQPYYVDDIGNLYTIDKYSSLIGNLVGKIEDDGKFIIDGKCIFELDFEDEIKPKIINKNMYYIDKENNLYKGFHKKLMILYEIGKYEEGRIKCI